MALLRDSAPTTERIDSIAGALLLDSLATEAARVRIDFTQYAVAYYVHDGEDHSSLAAILGYASALAQRGQASQRLDVRMTGGLLAAASEDLATILDQRFLHTGGTPREVFAAYAADHGRAAVVLDADTGVGPDRVLHLGSASGGGRNKDPDNPHSCWPGARSAFLTACRTARFMKA
ncbi:hypothetical protein [Streptomyces alanosinicus]|uniref:Uncharacterized protein n=1 Tax=Streptomyces alanosinicus TaxID=68171 RepID=A0A919D702_9ACTN|nr:hypothetical protein [Streptomyces alanosinicus]GHE13304.1 hypothetical protein GCM10010339_79790 [Streptomyces alanosinicus]